MHFEHIYMHSKLHLVTPARSSPVPYPSPNFTSLLIQSTHKLQLVFFEVWSHPLWSGQPTRSDTLKENSLCPHCSLFGSGLKPSTACAMILTGYWLAWASRDNHNSSESHVERLLFCWFAQLLLFKWRVFTRTWTPAVRLLHGEQQHTSLSCHPVFLNNYTPFSFPTLKPEMVIVSSRAGSRVFSFGRGWRRSRNANPLWAKNKIRNQDFCLGGMQRGKKTTQMESNIIKM